MEKQTKLVKLTPIVDKRISEIKLRQAAVSERNLVFDGDDECSYLGDTLISISGVYEGIEEDLNFINNSQSDISYLLKRLEKTEKALATANGEIAKRGENLNANVMYLKGNNGGDYVKLVQNDNLKRMENNLIAINEGMSEAIMLHPRTEVLKSNLLVVGDISSERTFVLMDLINSLLIKGGSILIIDTYGEFNMYTRKMGGRTIPIQDFEIEVTSPGITCVTFPTRYNEHYYNLLISLLTDLLNSDPITGYDYIVFNGEPILFELDLLQFMKWVSQANEENINVIIMTIEFHRIFESYYKQLSPMFPYVLAFGSHESTDPQIREYLNPGEALLINKGNRELIKF
ncbi:hypothetical protein [Paenibacillus agricola]|uniref:Uncharacterized protein n=1 Tax=Paenibacillus agricola TaxID=2716264 RepID=A0ABX0JE32_9BACL|nr:hypothetical protein [Paenibacillus agricola]NHN33132.1 hypothetical protein [Paenibacillus agricola]